jgi:geranylgeranyl diphosphate synthase type I
MELYPHILAHLSGIERIMEEELRKEDVRVYGLLLPFIRRGGKRIRPALTLLCSGASGGPYDEVLAPAAVIEMFHNFTLIHDDIEDDSRFRRGEPALHVSHGIPMALNSGDALYTLLWKKLVSLKLPPRRLIRLQAIYAEAFKRVVEGQGIELSWIRGGRFDVSEEEYLHMISGKTSALMGLSCEAGAFIAGARARICRSLRSYGEKMGASEGKRTLMVVHFLRNAPKPERERLSAILSTHSREQADIEWAIAAMKARGSIDYARERALQLVEEAKSELARLPDSRDREALLGIATYVISRER